MGGFLFFCGCDEDGNDVEKRPLVSPVASVAAPPIQPMVGVTPAMPPQSPSIAMPGCNMLGTSTVYEKVKELRKAIIEQDEANARAILNYLKDPKNTFTEDKCIETVPELWAKGKTSFDMIKAVESLFDRKFNVRDGGNEVVLGTTPGIRSHLAMNSP